MIVNNKRIIRNTGMLYIRMLATMLINLLTIRYLLQALGAEDYGIFHLVAALVSLFSLVSGLMGGACQRYFSVALGRQDLLMFNRYFNLSILLYTGIALVVVVLAEPTGLWMINYKLVIPEARLYAANWVFQLSLFSFSIKLINTPYIAAINSYEKMSLYAKLSIVDALFRLSIVGILILTSQDKLIVYGALLCFQNVVMFVIYRIYCIKQCPGSHFSFYWNRARVHKMLNFTGWNALGWLSKLAGNQGLNILINLFFGPMANAAKSISDRIHEHLRSFIDNFYGATRPQITKLYAAGEKEQMRLLAYRSSRFSFFLIWAMALPLILETPAILELWLGQIETLWISFARLTLLFLALQIFEPSFEAMLMARGHVRDYQLWASGFTLLSLPLCYLFYKLGGPPQACFYVLIVLYTMAFIPRLLIVRKELDFPIKAYVQQVIKPCVLVGILSSIIPLLLYYYLNHSLLSAAIVITSSIICVIANSLYLGMLQEERLWLKAAIIKLIGRE